MLPSTNSTAPLRDGIVNDLLFHTRRFAEESGMSQERTDALVAIMKSNHERAVGERLTAERSFAQLKRLLLSHSVQRPPFSRGIFSLQDLKLITSFALSTYYRHYRLYQYAFTERMTLSISTKSSDLETAPQLPPLAEAATEAAWTAEQNEKRRIEEERLAKEMEDRRLEEERLKQEEIDNAFRSAISPDIKEKVAEAVEKHVAILRTEITDKLQRQDQVLSEKLNLLQNSAPVATPPQKPTK